MRRKGIVGGTRHGIDRVSQPKGHWRRRAKTYATPAPRHSRTRRMDQSADCTLMKRPNLSMMATENEQHGNGERATWQRDVRVGGRAGEGAQRGLREPGDVVGTRVHACGV